MDQAVEPKVCPQPLVAELCQIFAASAQIEEEINLSVEDLEILSQAQCGLHLVLAASEE